MMRYELSEKNGSGKGQLRYSHDRKSSIRFSKVSKKSFKVNTSEPFE